MSEKDIIEDFLEKYKSIQVRFLDFIENENNSEDNFQNLIQLFEDTKILDCQHEFTLFLHQILKVSNHHHRVPNFFSKLEQILKHIKDDIIKKYKNQEIFDLFKSNKRILLFLINEKILTVDENFVKQITSEKYIEMKYPQYFAPEIKPFLNEEWFPKRSTDDNLLIEELNKELPDDFYELRNKGENDGFICKLIRDDAVEDFIAHFNKNSIQGDATIIPSIYETNSFLIKNQKEISMIEYAAFFGSLKIFDFLRNEKIELKSSLWLYSIHSQNAELINILEDNHVISLVKSTPFDLEIKESIKCYHNDFVTYFFNNYLQKEDENSYFIISHYIKYYNLALLQSEQINKSLFCILCYYNYYPLVKVLLENNDADINNEEIQNHPFQFNSKSYSSI